MPKIDKTSHTTLSKIRYRPRQKLSHLPSSSEVFNIYGIVDSQDLLPPFSGKAAEQPETLLLVFAKFPEEAYKNLPFHKWKHTIQELQTEEN